MNNIYDVIIIGAGISGLVTAQTLLEKEPNLDLLILEAKDRIGGRTLSVPLKVKDNKTCYFDIGAHFVSSTQKQIQKYIKMLNLTLIPQQTGIIIGDTARHLKKFQDHPILGNLFHNYEIQNFFALLDEKSIDFQFSNLDNNEFKYNFYDSVTMENYIISKIWTETARNVVRNIVRDTCGVPASEVTVLFYLIMCNSCLGFTNQYLTHGGGAKEFWIEEGSQEICNRLRQIIGEDYILLEEPVIEIDYSKSTKINIQTLNQKIFICRHVVCAISPDEILKINFKPFLTRICRQALENSHKGHSIKFIVTYETNFWMSQGCSGQIFCSSTDLISTCYDATKNSNPALTGYIKYPNVFSFELDGSYKKLVLEQLAKYWGPEALNPIDYVEKSWFKEMYGGSCPMTTPGLGTLKWYYTLSKSIENRIYFASSEIASNWYGHMDGAIQSGYRTALNILYNLRPQTLTHQDFAYDNVKCPHAVHLKRKRLFNKYTFVSGLLISYILYRIVIKPYFNWDVHVIKEDI